MRYRIWGRAKSGYRGGWVYDYDSLPFTTDDAFTAKAMLDYLQDYSMVYDWVLVVD